jgi:hypothetical protein
VIIAIQCESIGDAGAIADASGASCLLEFLTNRNVEYRSTGSIKRHVKGGSIGVDDSTIVRSGFFSCTGVLSIGRSGFRDEGDLASGDPKRVAPGRFWMLRRIVRRPGLELP